ncbi:MAG: acetyl-CoA acetyltransferase [Pseudomonadota bacterium]
MAVNGDQLPIIVGVGQTVVHWDGEDTDAAPSPLGLCVDAATNALDDAGRGAELRNLVDTVAVVRTLEDSIPQSPYPFGRCTNYPGAITEQLGLRASRGVYSAVGGDQPQCLVNEYAVRLSRGECAAVLLCGAEATSAFKTASRKHTPLDWASKSDFPFEDRGIGEPLSTRAERRAGLGWPTNSYPLFEEAYRARLGLSRDDYLEEMAGLLEQFSEVAAENPHSQFPQARSAQFLKTASKANYPIAGPYLKWHVAQDAVNQGAALVLTTVGAARKAGVPRDQWIYLHGHSALKDCHLGRRPDLSRSQSLTASLSDALQRSELEPSEIEFFDIYSCFPCVVFLAAEALGLDWRKQRLTQTGGLPFFGGPGNNYSMHAIASVVERLRSAPGSFGLVLANGGYLSKHAAGVYSTEAPRNWMAGDSSAMQSQIDAAAIRAEVDASDQSFTGRVESFTVVHGRQHPEYVTLAVRHEDARVFVKVGAEDSDLARELATGLDPIGASVRLAAAEVNPQSEPNGASSAYELIHIDLGEHRASVAATKESA